MQCSATRTECLAASALAVSESLVSALAKALFVEREPRQSALPTESDTVELYLRARYLYGRSDEVSLEQSVKLFERVLSRAPTDPTLSMSYALTLSRLWFYGNPGAAEKALPAAEAMVDVMPLRARVLSGARWGKVSRCGLARRSAEPRQGADSVAGTRGRT